MAMGGGSCTREDSRGLASHAGPPRTAGVSTGAGGCFPRTSGGEGEKPPPVTLSNRPLGWGLSSVPCLEEQNWWTGSITMPPSALIGPGPMNFSISFPGAAIAALLGSVLPVRGPSLCWVHLSVCLSSPPECTSIWPHFPLSTQQDGLFLRAIAPFPGDTSVWSPSPLSLPFPGLREGLPGSPRPRCSPTMGRGTGGGAAGPAGGNSLWSAAPCLQSHSPALKPAPSTANC